MPTYSGNTVTVDSASENINISLNQGNAIIVSVEAAAFSGTVDFQSTIDGETYTNHPYISYHAASPTRSVAQLSSPTTYAAYVILPPVAQARIVVTYSSGSLEVVWREVDYKTSLVDSDTTYTAGDGLTLTSTDFDLDEAITTVTSIYNTALILGGDSQTAIDFGTSNEIDFKADNAPRLTLTSGALYPVTNNEIDLGTASLEFKDAFFDGTVTADAFAGPLTGNVTGDASGTAATVTTAAQSAITSLGTLTTLTVDNVIVNGTTIGHTGDTDLLTLTSANLAVAGDVEVSGSVEVATIDYTDGDLAMTIADGGGVTFAQTTSFGSIDVDGTAELDNITIDGAQGSDGQVLTSTGSAVAWEAVPGGGITYASQWVSEDDFDPSSDGVIGTVGGENLAARTEAAGSFGVIGDPMTESSGVFTFPATGVWYVSFHVGLYGSGSDTAITFNIDTTTDAFASNSSSVGILWMSKIANDMVTGMTSAIITIDNVSNNKVRFKHAGLAANITIAGAGGNNTWMEFIRLGDT